MNNNTSLININNSLLYSKTLRNNASSNKFLNSTFNLDTSKLSANTNLNSNIILNFKSNIIKKINDLKLENKQIINKNITSNLKQLMSNKKPNINTNYNFLQLKKKEIPNEDIQHRQNLQLKYRLLKKKIVNS